MIPSKEYIVKSGELADCMYFIIKGSATVISSEGIVLATLNAGSYFGEMAFSGHQKVRQATVQAKNDASVATLSIEDFNMICTVFPVFRQRILEIAIQRKIKN